MALPLLVLVLALLLQATARWRFEQVAPLLDPALTGKQRARLVEAIGSADVKWPSGAMRPVSAATLYRWCRIYVKRGFRALMPRCRSDRGTARAVKPSLIRRAFAMLREEPGRSLTMLLKFLGARVHVARSTLHRHLQRMPGYARLRALARLADRTERRRGLRRRFQATAPHRIWHADAKGPFRVRIGAAHVAVHVLTILDDASRAILATIVATAANLAAAVRLFRLAAARWGLPAMLYCDRASIFDSFAFRTGLAELGVYRIRTRAGNAAAHGKIERWHGCLARWFVRELRHQVVNSLAHLEDLLAAVVEVIYQDHYHRQIRTTPRKALDGRISDRHVSLARLDRAFLVRKELKSHAKSGELEVTAGHPFRVPRASLAGRRLLVVYDPVSPERAFVENERTGRRTPLVPLFEAPAPAASRADERGPGRLQRLLDQWRGRTLPQAEAGMGLPEIFDLLRRTLARRVPADEGEAETIQDFYRRVGPLPRAPLEAALAQVRERLGQGRPLGAVLAALERRIARERARGPEEDNA